MKGELIDKPISVFLLPEVAEEDWEDVFEQLKDTQFMGFCQNRQGTITVVRIGSRVKDFANKKKYYLEISPVKFMAGRIFGLINSDMSILAVSNPNLVISEQEVLPFDGLFHTHIEPSWTQLTRNHNIKIECGEEASAMVAYSETINNSVDCICIELVDTVGKKNITPEKFIQ